jgi:hypothetical protein
VTDETSDTYPVAYCAPGHREAAVAILAARGETVARIEEDPVLDGAPGVYVAESARTDLTRILPSRYEFTAPEPAGGWIREYWAWGLRVNSPRLAVVTSVI